MIAALCGYKMQVAEHSGLPAAQITPGAIMALVELREGLTPEDAEILFSDSLIARTGNDTAKPHYIDHPLMTYLSAFIDGVFSGAYAVIQYSTFEVEVHVLLLKRATRQSRVLAAMLLGRVFSNPSVLRVTGWVREDLTTAINHCLRMGFYVEGVKASAVRVNGEPRDIVLLGLTRSEWERASE